MEAQICVGARQLGSSFPPSHTITQSQTCTSSPPPRTAPSNASSSDSSSTATASSQPRHTVPSHPDTEATTAQSTPSNDAIEAAIRAAITSSTASSSPRSTSSSVPSIAKSSGTSDGRTVPPRDTRTQLYVGNLPYRVRWQDLKDLFRRTGTVLRADVSLGPDNRSRGYGTVLLATAEDAGRAIDMFNGYEWQSRILEVRVDRIGGPMPLPGEPGMQGMPPQAPMMPGVSMMNSALYMNQLPQTSRGVLSPAPPFGGQHPSQASTYAIQNQQTTSQSRQIFSPQPQTLSLSHLHSQLHTPAHGHSQFEQLQQQYQGQVLQQQPPSIPGRTLFVGNLPYHVQWQDLKDLFRRTPGGVTVLRADVALGPDGRSKGFGTVTLRTEEETERAKRWFSGYEFNGRQLKVHHDRVPLSTTLLPTASPVVPSHSLSSSPLISHSMAMLNFGDALTSQRPTSPSLTSSNHASQAMRPRSETSSLQPPSINSRSASSPLLRQLQAHQQSQAVHQPSPLHSAVSVELAPSRVSPDDAAPGNGDSSAISRHRTSSTASNPSPPSTSPSMSRVNRPTHIALPPPSFNCDFDPSLASLEDLDNTYVEGNDRHHQNEHVQPEHQQFQQQTTPLQVHYYHRERGARLHQNEREREASRDYPSTEVRQQQQLYQLLHGSRQLATGGSNSPKPQLPKLSMSSTTTSSAASAASSTASLFETPERMHQSGHYGPTSLRESHSSGASSAAASTKSLPLGLGGGGSGGSGGSGGVVVPTGAPLSKAAISRDTSPGKAGTRRPMSTVSTTGSATSASDNNSSSTSFSSTSRTGSGSGSGSGSSGAFGGEGYIGKGDVDASEGWLNTAYSEKERQERSPHPHHPGSIALPPPFSSAGTGAAAGPNDVSESGMGKGLFQQYYPFAKVGSDQEGGSGGGFVEFSHSGEPTVQARPPVHTEDKRDVHVYSSSRRESVSVAQNEMQHQLGSNKKDVPGYFQPPPAPHAYPPMHPMPQLTPHGLPPMTPSMPPFTFVGSQQVPFLSPGMYTPTSPIGPGGTSHFQLRQQRMQQSGRSRPHPNAPGTLSLPPQQFVFVPHQQSPIISPASTIGPGTAPAPAQMPQVPSFLQPLGSPGSPYALGPHHPLHHAHHQQHHYHPQAANPYAHPPPPPPPPHPLSNSFGSSAGHGVPAMSPGTVGLAAMSPGAPWGKPGQMMKPYVNAAVGAPVRRNNNNNNNSNRERGSSRSRSRSKEQGREREQGEDTSAQQSHYYPHPAGGGGYWYHMSGVEPKGYFDLYMGPGEEGGTGGGSVGGDTSESGDRDRGESQSVVEREILRTKTGEGQSISQSSPDAAASAELGEEGESGGKGDRLAAASELVPPMLQHAKTEPADVEGHTRTRISRSLTEGEEL